MDQIVHRFRKGLWGPDSEVLRTYVFLPDQRFTRTIDHAIVVSRETVQHILPSRVSPHRMTILQMMFWRRTAIAGERPQISGPSSHCGQRRVAILGPATVAPVFLPTPWRGPS